MYAAFHLKYLFLTLFLICSLQLMAQVPKNAFFENYKSYRQEGLEKRRFRQQDILPLIEELKNHEVFSVEYAGQSLEGRAISLVKIGTGETSVLLWSQMHGDESTATMALMDVFNFFEQQEDGMKAVRQLLLEELTIYFIPMLNPDGAERYQRRNALGIDLNRDALRLVSPEAQILKELRDSLQADWGFNLHDQNIRYTAGKNNKPATISFLAPPYDEGKSTNRVRSKAMKLIVGLNQTLQQYIPGQVGKWSDEFEPRAFGDNIQKWGTSTVLIESGGYPGDGEKQYIRKLNFVAIMEGLQAIATEAYEANDLQAYYSIPENERYLFDLIIRNAQLEKEGDKYVVDIGINREEVELEGRQDFYYKSIIEELGDLSVFYGYEELDAEGMAVVPGKVYPEVFDNAEALDEDQIHRLISAGYTSVRLKDLPAESYTHLPLNLIGPNRKGAGEVALDNRPDVILKEGREVRYAIINGFIYDIRSKRNEVKNALVERN
jgi:hypothetical protein